MLSTYAANLKRMSLGPDRDAPAYIEAKKREEGTSNKEKCETSKMYHERTWTYPNCSALPSSGTRPESSSLGGSQERHGEWYQ